MLTRAELSRAIRTMQRSLRNIEATLAALLANNLSRAVPNNTHDAARQIVTRHGHFVTSDTELTVLLDYALAITNNDIGTALALINTWCSELPAGSLTADLVQAAQRAALL